jgi:hypothetical protein
MARVACAPLSTPLAIALKTLEPESRNPLIFLFIFLLFCTPAFFGERYSTFFWVARENSFLRGVQRQRAELRARVLATRVPLYRDVPLDRLPARRAREDARVPEALEARFVEHVAAP